MSTLTNIPLYQDVRLSVISVKMTVKTNIQRQVDPFKQSKVAACCWIPRACGNCSCMLVKRACRQYFMRLNHWLANVDLVIASIKASRVGLSLKRLLVVSSMQAPQSYRKLLCEQAMYSARLAQSRASDKQLDRFYSRVINECTKNKRGD